MTGATGAPPWRATPHHRASLRALMSPMTRATARGYAAHRERHYTSRNDERGGERLWHLPLPHSAWLPGMGAPSLVSRGMAPPGDHASEDSLLHRPCSRCSSYCRLRYRHMPDLPTHLTASRLNYHTPDLPTYQPPPAPGLLPASYAGATQRISRVRGHCSVGCSGRAARHWWRDHERTAHIFSSASPADIRTGRFDIYANCRNNAAAMNHAVAAAVNFVAFFTSAYWRGIFHMALPSKYGGF